MAPKKSKGSSSSATPIPDEARARALYKQLGAKKGWVESVRSDAQNPDFIHCLARTRVLLDNKELPDKKPKDAKEMAAFLKVALEVYTKLPDGCERPPGQPLSSLGMLVARAKLLQLLADEQQLKKEQLVEGLESISKQIKKGFSRDEWHKVWFDPKSDQCKELKEDDKAACSNMVLLAGSAAEQLLEAHSTYGRVYLQHLLTETDPDIRAAREELPTVPALKQPWGTEAAAAKDAANTAKAAAPASKQLDPKKALQQRKEQEQQMQQQMQQRKPGGRDTERARDTKHSKPAQDDKHQQELDAARNKEKEAKEDAAKVLDYLEKRLLAGGSSASSSAQQHMARLQEESRVSLEVLRKAIASLGNRDAKDKDKTELPQELQWCRQQLGDTNPSDNVLKQQLQQLQEKGPSAWQVWYDETVASKAASGGKAPKALYDSWEDFEEHVVHTHLVSAPDSMPLAFKDDTSEELAADVYKNKGQLQQPVADAAADAVRSGSVDSSSPWLKAFDKECPLQRFSLSMGSLRTEDHFITSVTTGFDGLRVQVACGFALLQAERQQVAVDRLQLSRKPAWAVLAYHSLRLLPAIVGDALVVDSDHYVTYNYWGNAEASSEDYARILQPNAQDASANGSTEDAALFTDGLAEDNATMLGMLRKDGMLCGPLLLALQLYLSKAAGTCLDLGSSKAQAKQQGRSSSGGVEFDREAVLGALRQLPERQQLELRLFLLRALYDCYAGLSAYVEFVQAEAQQRQRPAQVPVEVAGGGKEKGKDKGELALVLSQEFYEQACVSAAAPPEYHDGCCNKHHSQRLQAEAEGKQYSKFECSSLEEMMCPDQDMIIQADASVMQRYLLQPARVEPLMEQQGLQIGSRLGLKALVDALFGVGKHEQQLKALLGAPAEDAIKRSSWDKARTDMAIAAQLALHRRQLAALVEEDEAHLSDSNNSQWTRHDLKKRMRALLAQRSAGADWVLRMWMEHFKEQLAALRAEETSLQDQLRSLSDAPEKDKGAKGGSKENPKEREEALNRKLQQVNAGIVNAETALANVKVALNKAVNEAEGFSDLIRATYSCESAQTDSLLQALTLLTNELLTDSHPSTAGVAAQLGEALGLSRLALFDLDVWVMGHALTARRHVLSSMWKHAQPRAVLALSTEALKSHLKEGISKRAELELLALEEESKQTQQQQQPQQGKAAGKKKKKKGGAAKPAGPSLMDRIAGSDSENEEDEAAAAAEAEAEEAAKAAAEEDEEEQEEQEEDGWNNKLNIDMAKLDFQPVHHSKARTDSRDKEHGSSSSSRAASSQAAAAAAPARPAGRGEAAAGGAAGAHPAASRGPRAAAAADADPVIPGVNSPEVCATCGSIGHLATRCPEHYCSTCHKHGHPDGKCDTACSNCGKMHPGRHACKLGPCHFCKLWGHERVICPAERCLSCNYRGHKAMRCPGVCRRCGKHGHVAAQCNAKPCPTCQQFGHEYGSPECGQQSSSSSRRPPAAEAGRPASGSRPPQQAAAAAAPRPAVSGAAAAPAAAAGPQLFKASNLRLQSGEPDEQQRGEFIEKLFNANSAALVNYAMGLIEQRAKASVLARLLAADLAQILEQQDPVATLEEVYGHFAVGRMGSKQPTNLLPEGRRAFEEALPQRLRAQLQVGWERAPRWVEVERQLEEAAAGSWGKAERDAFEEAKARARQASFDAEAALKEQRAQQETKKQARQQQQREREQQQREQQQREQQQRELERRPSGSGELRPSSNGGSSSTSAWPAPGEPAATAAPPPPAAAGDPPTPAKVSFAAASQQAQEQPAAAMQQPGEPMQQVGAAGISMPPAMLSEQPGHHQQPPMQPYAGMPGQPAPSGQPWAPGMPPPGQQQQQQQQFGGMEQQDLPLHAFAGVPQPWMIWHRYGATYAINQLVEVEQMREHLLQAGVQPALEMQVAPLLHGVVMSLLRNLKESNEDASEGLLRLAEMVHLAVKAGPTPPPPMPSPAPMAVLPPHLQRSYQQQPQPAVAHMLPPHLQHHHTPEQQQQQQQQPMWQQQQQQPAGDDDSDDDDLMNILTGSASGAAAAAPGGQQQPAWGGAAGQQQQQHGGPGSEFPALGVERGSGGGGSRAAVPGVSTAGLANETGEYNCFLNVVVQCLYNCRDFRNSVWELPSYVATHPVVVAMRKLFIDMQQAEATWQPGGERIVVNPTALREALDCETHFKQQEMNDAMELLDTLYECFRKAQGAGTVQGSRGVLVDSVFGLLVKEAVACRQPNCGKRTHVIGAHWEHLLVVNSMALTFAAYDAPGGADMGRLLRTLFDQEQKMCDKDERGCGTQYPPERACEAAPKVLTLQLVWNQDVASSEIESALAHVQEHVDINPLYAGGCDAADTTYELSSAVAYYGQHYMAFVHNTKLHTWLLFDDASVSVVGSWQDVIRKCTAGKIQPSVLFYQTVDLAAVAGGAPPPAMQQQQQQQMHAPAPMHMGMPAAAGGPGAAPWAGPAAAAMSAGGPPHMAMPGQLQQPHQMYQQPPMHQQPMQQQPVPVVSAAGPYSQPPPQQQQQQGGWPAAGPPGATDGSGHGGGWHTVQQPADAAAAWSGTSPAAPAAAAPPPQQQHPAAGAAPSQGAAQQTPAKVAWPGGPGRGGASLAAGALRAATGQAARPGAAPGGGRGRGPTQTGPPPGRGEGPHGGRGPGGRG